MTSLTSLEADVQISAKWADLADSAAATAMIDVYNPASPWVLTNTSGPFNVYYSEPTPINLVVKNLELFTSTGTVVPTKETLTASVVPTSATSSAISAAVLQVSKINGPFGQTLYNVTLQIPQHTGNTAATQMTLTLVHGVASLSHAFASWPTPTISPAMKLRDGKGLTTTEPLTGQLKGGRKIEVVLTNFYRSPWPADIAVEFVASQLAGYDWTVINVESTVAKTTLTALSPQVPANLVFNSTSGDAETLEVQIYPRKLGVSQASKELFGSRGIFFEYKTGAVFESMYPWTGTEVGGEWMYLHVSSTSEWNSQKATVSFGTHTIHAHDTPQGRNSDAGCEYYWQGCGCCFR